jgi:hypothetical protein
MSGAQAAFVQPAERFSTELEYPFLLLHGDLLWIQSGLIGQETEFSNSGAQWNESCKSLKIDDVLLEAMPGVSFPDPLEIISVPKMERHAPLDRFALWRGDGGGGVRKPHDKLPATRVAS